MKNKEAMTLYNACARHKGRIDVPNKFAWAVMRTMKMVESSLIATYEEKLKPTAEFMAYETERRAICEREAVKDANSQPLTREVAKGQFEYVFPDNNPPIALGELVIKHKEALAYRQSQIDRANQDMELDYDGGIYQCDEEHLPSGVSADDLAAMEPLFRKAL